MKPHDGAALEGPAAEASLGEARTIASDTRAPGSVTAPVNPEAARDPRASLSAGADGDRYRFARVLGAGGMGEVQLCSDERVGREVALKRMHEGSAENLEALRRFVREARVQGQLEHPSVVPVYELGAMPDGSAFFTMKRVKGVTLEDALAGLREGREGFAEQYTQRRLLLAFVTVCHALEYAHARGVLHRDLKPANVMLGSFGEVHVLDWGLAKIVGHEGDGEAPVTDLAAIENDPSSKIGHTRAGALMGTPGYMSPEQARGEVAQVDARSDVYALGCVLFELLAGKPLHEARGLGGLLQSTVQGADARVSERAPEREVAPELEAICVRATALDPNARFSDVRSMREALERFLDGDRDVERRREMAAGHARAARGAAMRAVAGSTEARAEAMREVARTLALDPQNGEALTALAFVLMNAPERVPPEAADELAARTARSRARALRLSALRYATWLAFVPFAAVMGPRNWVVALSTLGAIVASSAFAYAAHKKGRSDAWSCLGLVTLSNVAIGLLAGWFGPFIVAPGLASTNALFFASFVEKSVRPAVVVSGVLALLLPFALDVTGLVPPAYTFAEGTITVHARMIELPPSLTVLVLCLANAALVGTPAMLAGRLRDELDAAERRLFLQGWQLRQLVPEEARAALDAMGSAPAEG